MKKNLTLIFSTLSIIFFTACQQNNHRIVGIRTLGKFNASLVDTVQYALENAYGFQVIVLENKPIPKSAFVNIKSARYRADSLIKILKEEKPDSIDYVIGLTHKDISFTKKGADRKVKEPASKYQDWGICGLGYRPGPTCVVSTYRLTHINRAIFFERLKKVSIHEIGHNLGLKHCKSGDKCVMKDAAESVSTIDQVSSNLCEVCRRKI